MISSCIKTMKTNKKVKQWVWFFALYFAALAGLGLFTYVARLIVPGV